MITLFPNRTGTVQFQNYPKPTLTVNKIDSITGDPIKGAKFNVTFRSDKTSTGEIRDLGTYYSDENGQFFIDKLDDGWYTITELEPAAGYSIKDPTSQQVYVEAGRGKVVTFENTPLSAIIVKKVDSSTGDPLQGAWFRVRFLGGTSGTGGTVIAERQTSSNGTFILTGLKAGTYVIEEISAPDGYVLSENDIQTVYLSGNEQDVITVTFGNEAKGSVLIKKIDAITREPLSDGFCADGARGCCAWAESYPSGQSGALCPRGDGKLSLYGADGLYSCEDSRGQGGLHGNAGEGWEIKPRYHCGGGNRRG